MNADPTVMEFFPATMTQQESVAQAEFFNQALAERGFTFWAVERRADGRFIGLAGLSVPSFEAHFTPAVEIGWRLPQEFWGHGYATEAAYAALRHGFTTVGLDQIVSFTTRTDQRSRRVMERLGLTHDPDEDFDHPRLPGHPLQSHVLYRISRADWAGRQPVRPAG